MHVSYLPDSTGKFQSSWCLSQPSSLLRKCALLGCWTAPHHYSPGSLSCRTASKLMTQVPSPYRHEGIKPRYNCGSRWWQSEAVWGKTLEKRTSFSFRMLHWKGVTDAGLEGGSFCLISWAAASSRPVFRLEMTTLQPEEEKKSVPCNIQLHHCSNHLIDKCENRF